ncbi:MAG TPA: IS110 family transposase [Gemmatimonadales bacterium]|nr:IS110 family transposase [Gemmatimonadales bacterium]
MSQDITYVGLDAHQETIHAGTLLPGAARPAEDAFANSPEGLRRFVRRLRRRAPGEVVCAYEAGPLGYGLMRELEALDVGCVVVAPALIPIKPGDRIKTDRRDARKLAELLRSGLLTAVHAPTPEQEAVRDLCRAREAVKRDQTRVRHRLSKLLLRRGVRWTRGRRAWTRAHLEWLRGRRFEHPADQAILDDHLLALEQLESRLAALDAKLEAFAQQAPWNEPVGWLRCFRGIDTLTALSLAAEIHDWRRFSSPRELMAYVGMVPSERSSGGKERRGGITRAGNGRVRRLLIEAAWHYRHRPAVGYALRERRRGQPPHVIAIADRAQHRLYARYRRLLARGKAHNQVTVAVGRELVGFLWTALDPHRPETT